MSASWVLNTTDAYQELYCPDTARVNVQVANAPINIGFGQGTPPGAFYPNSDEVLGAVVAGLARRCDAIRIKSQLSGTPAQVYITTLTAHDG